MATVANIISACTALTCIATSTLSLAVVFDDFNDNVIDSSRWNPDLTSGPAGISLVEQNGRLELLSSFQSLSQQLIFKGSTLALPYNSNWSVSAEVHNLLDVHTGPSARMGIIVSGSNVSDTIGILLKADNGGRRLQGYNGAVPFGPDFWIRPINELSDNGILRISYNDSNRLVSLSFSNGIDVEQPVVFGTLGVDGVNAGTLGSENWHMLAGNSFILSIMGTTTGTIVGSGQVFIDNISSIPEPTSSVLLSLGLLSFGLFYIGKCWRPAA